ncbi:MAG: peptidylprolyl isomerase [Treponemataceae bacterium]|nr:peptidylprolyl isomerase [Treponemataceae bacterium]
MKKWLLIVAFAVLTIIEGVCSPMSADLEAIKGRDGVFAVMETSSGNIVLELFYKEVPLTVTNFVGLAEGTLDAAKGKPFYDGLKFHRVIADFMIQGGDPLGNGTGGPGYKFPDEFVEGLIFDKPGKLAMANSGANTNGSQFFITHVPTDWLNYKHTIFGEVVKGQDVVDSVKQGDKIVKVTIVRQGSDAENFTATQSDFDKLQQDVTFENWRKEKAALAKLIDGCEMTKSGIYYKINKKGKGDKPSKGQTVTTEYVGKLTNGQIFDASKHFHPQGHGPLTFKVGAGEMIPGFDEMVLDMKVGEIRYMLLPPELAYGARGIPQAGIPGNARLIFEVERVK